MHTRHCVACDEEFRPEIVYCSDCGALLEDRWEGEGAREPEPEPEVPPAPDVDYAPVFHAVDSGAVSRAAARLARAEIPFRVTPGFDLLVPHDALEAAMEVLKGREGALAVVAGADSALVEGRCPACDGHVPQGAIECPECGLVVGNDDSLSD